MSLGEEAQTREFQFTSAMASDPPKTYPFFTLSSSNSSDLGFFDSSQKPLPPPPPCVEVPPSEAAGASRKVDPVFITEELTLFKGRVNTKDVFGVSDSDLVPGKYEGGLKLWEGSIDLVKSLMTEIQHGRLSLSGKRVLELGCGHGLPGITTCLKGAAVVHFQDFNAEVLQNLTIPNVESNLTKCRLKENNCPSKDSVDDDVEANVFSNVRFFAGDWKDIHPLLISEHGDGSFSDKEISTEEGYDVILMAETFYSLSTVQHLYDLIKKCLRPSYGVIYLAGKKHYFGVGGGTRQFLNVVNEDGVLAASLLTEVADGSSNVREVWKLSFKAEHNKSAN